MESEPLDPRHSLELLQSSRMAAEVEGEVPYSPLWYSAALATTIGGAALFDGGAGGWAWLLLAAGAGVAVAAHYFPTVRVLPRRSRRGVIANLVIFVVIWLLLSVWGVFTNTVTPEPSDFQWWFSALAVWLATALTLAGAMAAMNRWRYQLLANSGAGE